MAIPFSLPEELQLIVGDSSWEKDTLGMSEASVFKLAAPESQKGFYLKVTVSANERLETEARILRWLKGKLPVPEVLYYGEHGEIEYLLLSEIVGYQAKSPEVLACSEQLGRLMAEGLKVIHSLDISDCPFHQSLTTRIAGARYRVEHGLVEDDFEPENRGKIAEALLRKVEENQSSGEDKVFTHGDYSLANIIVKDGSLEGTIDWGRAGVSDRHQDLAIAIRSLKHNAGPEAVAAFKRTYGETWFDPEKIAYYILLDELF